MLLKAVFRLQVSNLYLKETHMIDYINGKHVAIFGYGSICLLPGLNSYDNGLLYFIYNPEWEREPGGTASLEELGITLDNVNSLSDILFIFDNARDIDNLIDSLNEVKKLMIGKSQKKQEL